MVFLEAEHVEKNKRIVRFLTRKLSNGYFPERFADIRMNPLIDGPH